METSNVGLKPALAFDAITAIPRRRVASYALFRNADEQVLIVQPTRRDDGLWQLVGGSVEQGKPPRVACAREVREELGIVRSLGQFLCVEYLSATARSPESLHFTFDGGVLAATQIQQIVLQTSELAQCGFCTAEEAIIRLVPQAGRRLRIALTALEQGSTLYVEDNTPAS